MTQTATCYLDIPGAVESVLRFRNLGAGPTPVLSNVTVVDAELVLDAASAAPTMVRFGH